MRSAMVSAACLALMAGVAGAEPVNAVSVRYDVDVGPLTMMVVKYQMKLDGGAISSEARIKSNGIANVFSDYSAKAEAESRAGGKGIAPQRFRLVREKDDRKKETTLDWSGGELTYAPMEKKPWRRETIARALTGREADPMTAVLRIGSAGDNPCPTVQTVFDGRDVFELSLTDKGAGEIETKGYRGPVRRCEVGWTPIAGRAAEKNEPRDTYEVAFAHVGELPTGRKLWLPVQLSGRLKGLRFEASATRLSTGGAAQKALVAE